MPSVNDPVLIEEDTPDDLKGAKTSKKKKQKKGAKQRATDEYKDSSSEGPKLSPDLPPVVDHTSPFPPPSPPPDDLNGQAPEGGLLDHLAAPYEKPALVSSIVLPSEPSPPQDGVIAAQDKDDARLPRPLPTSFNAAQHAPSLSSSPQGGIRLSPSNTYLHAPSASPPGHAAAPPRERKASTTTHLPKPTSFYEPPPPHLPQRHFTRRPDMDFGFASPTDPSVAAGSKGSYCGFDSLQNANAGTSPAANNVVLVGTQGGLDVYRLLRQRSDIVGRLEGLRGAVVDAKILPWTERHDPFHALRPLVMCLLHGPMVDTSKHADDDQPLPADSPSDAIPYQTSVEIFSLASAESLCTIFESPLTVTQRSATPTPAGNLRIAAEGRFITVTSGTSGEIYVFSPYTLPTSDRVPPYHCIGKFWTTAHAFTSSPSSDPGVQHDEFGNVESKTPTWALSERWLAIRPPLLSSSQTSLQGVPLLSPKHPDPPGVSAHVSPPPPAINCEVDAPFNNTLFDRMTKQATHEIRKGAHWVGEQGKQVWNAYWSRSSPIQGEAMHHGFQHPTQVEATLFPPTHAQLTEPHPIPVEPSSISLIDLHKLLDFEDNPAKGALTPLSTFGLSDGCSFMSFAPGGLSLLTTNQTGDASTIWDLARITNGKLPGRYSSASASGIPDVFMAARFARQTPSVVIEVAWSAHGNRVALLTQKGTVHLHEVPSSCFRPMLHGGGISPSVHAGIPSPGSSPQADAPANGFVSSVRARFQTFPGISLRPPTNSTSIGATVSNASAYARHTGRKALKQGVNMATDTALKIRHHEETKIRLQPKQHVLRPACLRWLSGRDSGLIATVFDGKVRLHSVKSNHYVQGKRTALYLTASRRPVGESTLHSVSGDAPPPGLRTAACARTGPHGFWALNKAYVVNRACEGMVKQFSASVIQDKDTSPTYLPFHRSPQVNLFTFPGSDTTRTAGKKPAACQGMGSEEAWVFGLPLPPTVRITCQQSQPEEDYDRDIRNGDIRNGDMDLLAEMPESLEEGNAIGAFEM